MSNLGPYDVDFFAAIINPPEAGILAIGAAKKMPVVLEDGTLGVGMRMKATLSVDHRVSDGAEGGRLYEGVQGSDRTPDAPADVKRDASRVVIVVGAA